MKKTLVLFITALALVSCGNANTSNTSSESSAESSQTETSAETEETTAETTEESQTEAPAEHVTAPQNEVGYEGMEAVGADTLNDGEYPINVDSSSSMFKIAGCTLNVKDGSMEAVIAINSQSYEYLFMGTDEEAKNADESAYIPYTTDENGQSLFTVPVEALDKEIQCASFSVKKQEWYARTLVFRSDSLPDEAFSEKRYKTVEDLGLEDGEYIADVKLDGGSGRATVQSPAKLTIKDGKAVAEIIWSSNKYDYMLVDGEKILPVSTEEFSVFEIPVTGFEYDMPVSADTTAMSKPYEIEYTIHFDNVRKD